MLKSWEANGLSFLLLWPHGCKGKPGPEGKGRQRPGASPTVLLPKNVSKLSDSLLEMVEVSPKREVGV